MILYDKYDSPLGRIVIGADEQGLTGLYFEDVSEKVRSEEKDPVRKQTISSPAEAKPGCRENSAVSCEQAGQNAEAAHRILEETARWLDRYFAGREPGEAPPVHAAGSPFQTEVWNELVTIPYGQTVTYGDIAKRIASRRGIPRMAAQAVGGAVGANPVSLVVPCHRVVGLGGRMVGYGGGIDRKMALLEMEKTGELRPVCGQEAAGESIPE